MAALAVRSRVLVLVIATISAFPLAIARAWAQASPPAARIDSHPDVQAAQRLFTAWIEGQILERGLPGLAVGVVSDQELVWAKGFGSADTAAKTPMTPQTRFRMASHSKLFTATAVMQLREDGKLRLDDPVATHLPWFTVKRADPDDPPITIEELLTGPPSTFQRARSCAASWQSGKRRSPPRSDGSTRTSRIR
jgi:D-alanyl-D-alanine carboxypeptidase